jgi:peptide subunit release factor 1 (eRF1)
MTEQILERAEEPRITSDVSALIQRLAAIPVRSHPVLSCYVRLEPQDRIGDSYLIALKDRVRALHLGATELALAREDRLAVERDLERILGYLSHPADLPHAPGLALFAGEDLDLFEAAPLPRVHRTRLILDDTPWIAELLTSKHAAEPVLTVVIDRKHARIFEVTSAGSAELACVMTASLLGGKFHSDREEAPGWGEHGYHRRLKQEHHRHYAAVVQRVEELLRTRAIRGLVLAGTRDSTSALARFLPDRLGRHVLGTAKLNPTAISSVELQATTLTVAAEHDRKTLIMDLAALDDAVGRGWAVNGPRETLRALHRGQARTLFIREDLEGRGFRCSGSGRLVLAKGDCRDEGNPQPVRDLVDESIEEALHQRVRVVMVPDGAEAEAVDGLAATLRFR